MSTPDYSRDVAAVQRVSAVPNILEVIAETTGVGLTLVARVTKEQWVACAVLDRINFGLKPGDTLDVATTLCSEVRDTLTPVIINNASQDPGYCTHPTPRLYNFESYIAVPIFTGHGEYFGNLCALDPKPADLRDPKFVKMVKLFAELIGRQLNDEAALRDVEETAELREQFIAVLGHDLRNPLSSISMGAQTLLRRGKLGEQEQVVTQRIRASVGRMTRLVDGLLDFARGRRGGGMKLSMSEVTDLEKDLRHVIAELEAAHPAKRIDVVVEDVGAVVCDRERVAQVLSNLLANALEHGPEESVVRVAIRGDASTLLIEVTNGGAPLSPETMQRIFKPYQRGEGNTPRAGLGLGLYIVSEITRAHGAKISVTSTAQEGTTFRFTMPRKCADGDLSAPSY